MTPWTEASQAPLSTGFSRQEYWSGLTFPPPRDLSNSWIEPLSPALAGRFATRGTRGGAELQQVRCILAAQWLLVVGAAESHPQSTCRLFLVDLNSHALQSIAEAAVLKGTRLRRRGLSVVCFFFKKEQWSGNSWTLETWSQWLTWVF